MISESGKVKRNGFMHLSMQRQAVRLLLQGPGGPEGSMWPPAHLRGTVRLLFQGWVSIHRNKRRHHGASRPFSAHRHRARAVGQQGFQGNCPSGRALAHHGGTRGREARLGE